MYLLTFFPVNKISFDFYLNNTSLFLFKFTINCFKIETKNIELPYNETSKAL